MIGQRWGVSDEEVERTYPCDVLIAAPALPLWRGVTVDVPAERMWPWLCQLRLAPYSYDWVDNLGHRSPREMRNLPDPLPGEAFSRIAGRLPVGRIVSAAHTEHVTARIMGALMSYVLVPRDGTTRLLLKVAIPRQAPYASLLGLGDWPMARRQMLNLKALAESGRP